jgi:hypothetical protein
MSPVSPVCLSASQHQVQFENDTVENVAGALLASLRAPVQLEWKAEYEDPRTGSKSTVILSTRLESEGSAWPPRKFDLKVIPPEIANRRINVLHSSGLGLSSSVSASEFVELLNAGITNDTQNLAKPTPSAAPLVALPLVDSDKSRRLLQPQCLQQWNSNTCGYHALFSVQCLLEGETSKLCSPHYFWQRTLSHIQALAEYGETSGRWPRSRVTKGVADGVHLRHLVESSDVLRGRVTIAETLEEFEMQIREPMNDILSGHTQAHGFVLAGTCHWYAAAVATAQHAHSGIKLGTVPKHLPCSASGDEIHIFFCDSYNRPLVNLGSEEHVAGVAEELVQAERPDFMANLRMQPEWAHRPQADLDKVFEEGLPEWWKGVQKSSLFWRSQPLELKRNLKIQELTNIKAYLESINVALMHTGEFCKVPRTG